jgi:predicted nucleic acid-binding protein
MLSYFDSSVLLSMLFNEQRYEEASEYWHTSQDRASSILLKIETIISLRRIYEYNKWHLPDTWLTEKTKELNEYLQEMSFRNINRRLEKTIYANTDLARCRTLDAIHIATALEIRKIGDDAVTLYTFDTNMHELAERFGFETNTQ